MRHVIEVIAFLVLVIAVFGCGGRTRHEVRPETPGGLAGIAFNPPDHSRFVSVDVEPHIFWEVGQPPARFTVSMHKILPNGQLEGVLTELERIGNRFEWKLKPTERLYTSSLYAIRVSSDVEVVESWFLTEETPSVVSERKPHKGSGAVTHDVTVTPLAAP